MKLGCVKESFYPGQILENFVLRKCNGFSRLHVWTLPLKLRQEVGDNDHENPMILCNVIFLFLLLPVPQPGQQGLPISTVTVGDSAKASDFVHKEDLDRFNLCRLPKNKTQSGMSLAGLTFVKAAREMTSFVPLEISLI